MLARAILALVHAVLHVLLTLAAVRRYVRNLFLRGTPRDAAQLAKRPAVLCLAVAEPTVSLTAVAQVALGQKIKNKK